MRRRVMIGSFARRGGCFYDVMVHWFNSQTAEKKGTMAGWFGSSTMLPYSRIFLTYLCAGGPSMMILIHRICMALSGLGKRITVERAIRVRAAILLQWISRAQMAHSEWTWHGYFSSIDICQFSWQTGTYVLSWNRTKFLMLWKMAFPSSIADLPNFTVTIWVKAAALWHNSKQVFDIDLYINKWWVLFFCATRWHHCLIPARCQMCLE